MHIPLRKRLPALFLTLCMILGLAACGTELPSVDVSQEPTPHQTFQSKESPDASEPDDGPSEAPDTNNILIAYFSLWDNAPWDKDTDTDTSASVVVDDQGAIGTTGYVARMIQSTVGGDIHVIQASEPYPADFDAVVDENHQESGRDVSSTVENMEQYDTVFIGYPVWATTLPQAVRTCLTSYGNPVLYSRWLRCRPQFLHRSRAGCRLRGSGRHRYPGPGCAGSTGHCSGMAEWNRF